MSSANPLETAFKPTRSMTERVNVVGELVNIKVSSPVDADFSVQVSHNSDSGRLNIILVATYV